jgi:NAD(P)-dependent dehydrogenase (short-subunit alcohol dehydrogenase family)
MKPDLKPISGQVMVITGASSGIGLATAREAARRGAKLVLASRNEAALRTLVDELRGQQHEALFVVADVGKESDVDEIARQAIARFGRFDTWVNNAGVTVYGAVDQPSMEENRRLFDTNFWGVVHGSLAASRHLREHGGAVVTVASMLSDVSLPMQGMYCASKHAIKGFINSQRMEMERSGAPVSYTLIKPASINSMLPEHARNYMPNKPDLPPPLYAPRVVADAILHAAQHPVRDLFVGEPAVAGTTLGYLAPGLSDLLLRTFAVDLQKKNEQEGRTENGNLFKPADTGPLRESQQREGMVFQHSPYTEAMTAWRNPFELLRKGMKG